jgi:hypothetical protein
LTKSASPEIKFCFISKGNAGTGRVMPESEFWPTTEVARPVEACEGGTSSVATSKEMEKMGSPSRIRRKGSWAVIQLGKKKEFERDGREFSRLSRRGVEAGGKTREGKLTSCTSLPLSQRSPFP